MSSRVGCFESSKEGGGRRKEGGRGEGEERGKRAEGERGKKERKFKKPFEGSNFDDAAEKLSLVGWFFFLSIYEFYHCSWEAPIYFQLGRLLISCN